MNIVPTIVDPADVLRVAGELAARIIGESSGLVVSDQATSVAASAALSDIAATIKGIAAKRLELTRPHDAHVKRLIAAEREICDPLRAAEAALKGKLTAYQTALREAAEAEARRIRKAELAALRAQAEADRIAREATQRAADEQARIARAAADKFAAEAKNEKAKLEAENARLRAEAAERERQDQLLEAQWAAEDAADQQALLEEKPLEAASTRIAGFHTRSIQKIEVTDLAALCRHVAETGMALVTPDMGAIRAALKLHGEIPGITVRAETVGAIR